MEIQWPLVLFSLLAGTGGTMFAFAGLSEVLGGERRVRETAALCATVLVVLGGCFSVLHLASPLHAISAVTNLLSFSGISIELMLLGVNFIVMVAYVVLSRREGSSTALRVLGVVGVVAGCALAFFCGHGYVIAGQPTWNTNALPCAYLGTCIACGAFAYALLAARAGAENELGGNLGAFVWVCAALGAASAAVYALVLGEAALAHPVVLFAGVVLFGVAGVLVFGVAAWRVGKQRLLAVCGGGLVCAYVGGVAVRVLMWLCATGFINLFAHTVPSVMLNL